MHAYRRQKVRTELRHRSFVVNPLYAALCCPYMRRTHDKIPIPNVVWLYSPYSLNYSMSAVL